ncbi:slipin family protein [Treponema pedis]|uniref:slipin family protein n=1 Tax=Treponema pedis TaxID=409322 RepID=UPI00197EAC3B|nr:slipin family protein [Treponema pedis]QSI04341.1 slipin family protein [Treponema pedis]
MRIQYDERALLFKHGKFIKLLGPCFFLNLKNYKIEKHSVYEELCTNADKTTLLLNKDFTEQVEFVELQDNNIALYFDDGIFKDVLTAGKHIFWKNNHKKEFITADLNNPCIDTGIISEEVINSNFLQDYIIRETVESYEKGLLFIDKTFIKILEAGSYYFWKGSKLVNIIKADMRSRQIEISGQEILTKDKISLRLNFVCQYKIADPIKALAETEDYESQLYTCLQLALREYIGTMTFDELLEKKEEVNKFVINILKTHEEKLGVTIIFSGLKDIILPGEIRDIINQVLIAEKKAQANVITRREETASTRSLLNTAKLMEENSLLLKLKELEYIDKISEKINQISVTGGGQILDQLKEIFTGKL